MSRTSKPREIGEAVSTVSQPIQEKSQKLDRAALWVWVIERACGRRNADKLLISVRNHQFRICSSFSQGLLASNIQTLGWRVVPFVALWVNFGLGGGRLKPANAQCACLSNTAHKGLFCAFPSLSVWLTCKMRLLAFEITITNDLAFLKVLYSWWAFLLALAALKAWLCPRRGWLVSWCDVGSEIPPYSGGGSAVATLRKQGGLWRLLVFDSLDNGSWRGRQK